MKYDAFISYRHAPLDLEMAKKVHSGLENYHVPAATQKKIGKKKINRVFRDQEELPIGSDLDDNISGALAESEYLIVICSPRSQGSYWVRKEIDTFIYMHDREHVLAVLIEGEPDESFPPQLLTDETGRAVEPLAADLRGATAKERNHKFKTEILRLAAPILGCNYDDLKLRHRERIIKRNITIAACCAGVVALAGTAFGIYNAGVARKMSLLADEKAQLADEKTQLADEILTQYTDKQVNQSRYLASESLSLYSEGNVLDAVLVAEAALPSDDNDRPYVPAAEYALGIALHAYSTGDTAEYSAQFEHKSNVRGMAADADTTILASYDQAGYVYVWDINTGTEKVCIAPVKDSYGSVDSIVQVAVFENTLFVCRKDGISEYDFNGNMIAQMPIDDYVLGCEFYPESRLAVEVTNDEAILVNLTNFEASKTVENAYDLNYNGDIAYCSKKGLVALAHFNSEDTENYIEIINTDTLESRTVKISDSYCSDLCMNDDGMIAVLSYNADDLYSFSSNLDVSLDYIDAENAETVWSNSENAIISHVSSYDTFVRIHSYGEENQTEIVMVVDNGVYSYDTEGKSVSFFSLSDSAEAIAFTEDSDVGLVAEYSGNIDYVNFSTGNVVLSDYVDTNCLITDMLRGNGIFLIMSQADCNITSMRFETAYDLSVIADNDYYVGEVDASADGKYVVPVGYDGHFSVYSGNGSLIAEYDADYDSAAVYTGFNTADMFVSVYGSYMYVYDPSKDESHKYPLTNQDMSWLTFSNGVTCSDGKHLLTWGSTVWALTDTETGKVTATEVTESYITAIAVSDDLSKVYVCNRNDEFYAYDTATGDKEMLSNEYSSPIGILDSTGCMSVSRDGKYVALLCNDGYVRIFATKDSSVSYELTAAAQAYFYGAFTPDSSVFLYQTDDKKIHFINIADCSPVSTIEAGGYINRVDFDTDGGIVAIKINGGLLLADDDSYAELAMVSGGQVYLAGSGEIYAGRRKQIFSLYYKDYKTLLTVASQKYGDCSLTDEEKIKYFLD